MTVFDTSKEWTIVLPSDVPAAKKAAEDLSRYIGLLAGASKAPILDALDSAPEGAVIVLSSGAHGYEHNGFNWRVGKDRVEISGDSGRGLCNGIYSFLADLGVTWPAPGQEELPTYATPSTKAQTKEVSGSYPLTDADEFSLSGGDDSPAASLRRFVPTKSEVKRFLNKGEAFVQWAARLRYDAIVFPLAAYASDGRKLRQMSRIAGEYGIALEAGGRELSSLVPRRYFLFHRNYFRMHDGKRKKDHHFCPTNPDVIQLIAKESERLFRFAPDAAVIHLWPDKGAETAWCSCPTCRAFSSPEQNLIAINAAADAVAAHDVFISYYEKAGESGKIKPRANTFSVSQIPDLLR